MVTENEKREPRLQAGSWMRSVPFFGLDVHDPGPVQLQQGMTLTVEPGIYIPEERLGIRIEDIVLVTEEGSRVLGEPFPKTADEIEALMARR